MKPNKLNRKFAMLILIALLVLLLVPAMNVQAEGIVGQITAGSASVPVGSTVTVTFAAVPAVTISAYQVTVRFDTGKFEYVSGQDLTNLNGGTSIDNNGSSISVYAYGDTGIANISKLCRLTFRAKAEGSGTFTTSDAVINSESPASTSVAIAVAATGATTQATTAASTQTTIETTEATEATEATLEMTDGKYNIVPIPKDMPTPTGFYKTSIAVSGQQMEAFKSTKGDLILLYLDSDFNGTNLYFYDSNSNSVYLYNAFSIPGHDFALIRPDTSAVVPDGFASTSLTIDGQLLSCWKKPDITDSSDPYFETYLLYLMDSEGQKGFFLYKPAKQMIFPYLLISAETTSPTITSDSSGTLPISSQTEPGTSIFTPESSSGFNIWMISTGIFAVLCLMLIGFLIWTYFEYVRPAESTQHRPGHESAPRPPKIRRVD